mmetsp:Transcript_105140/g.322338  ORF Transcript_105140/g.322338 Transcript_105140/m.322338 type:complete len:339 (+) Transcript_105140:449-1465(+)
MPERADAEAPPVDQPAVQLARLVPPKVGVVRIQVVVTECNVVQVVVEPILDLGGIRRPSHHGLCESILESLRFGVLREHHLGGAAEELHGRAQAALHDARRLARCAVLVRAPSLHAFGVRRHSPEAVCEDLLAAHVPCLVLACDPRTVLDKALVILPRRPPEQLQSILAFVVGALDLKWSQRTITAWFADLRVRDPLSDQDEVRGFVADVAVIKPGRLARERRLEQPVRVDLLQVHGLLVDAAADAVALRFRCHREGHLGEQQIVQPCLLPLICHLEEEFAGVVASIDRHGPFDLQAHDFVVFGQRASCVEGAGQPRRPVLLEEVGAPREVQAVDHAR